MGDLAGLIILGRPESQSQFRRMASQAEAVEDQFVWDEDPLCP